MRKMAGLMASGLAILALACAPVSAEDANAQDNAAQSASRAGDVTRSMELAGFDRIAVGGIYSLDVTVGPAFAVELSGSPYMLEHARALVEDGVLRLDHAEELRCNRDDDCGAVRARITLPALAGLSIQGVSEDSRVSGIDADRFALAVEGVGGLTLAGRCNALDLEVQGVGNVDAESLQCADVTARIEGVGEVEVYASRSIDARVDAVGDLTVHGSPQQVEQHAGLLGEITIR